MNTDLRNRVILPILMPIGVLAVIGAGVAGIALMLLYTNRVLALTIAALIATGVMVAISLAASIDEADMTVGRKGVILMTAVLPVLLGAGVAIWSTGGGVPEETLNIRALPPVRAPEGAIVGAQNSQNFCELSEDESTCTDTQQLTLPAQPEAESFKFIFENLEAGVSHNFSIFELAGTAGAPEPGAIIFGVAEGSDIFPGVDEKLYEIAGNPLETGVEYFYNCVVHPNMAGVLTITEPEA